MNKLFKRGLMAATALAVPASALLAMPMAAHAATLPSSSTVKALTFTFDDPDTTSVSGPGTINTPNGPQWALDDLALQYSAVPTGAGSYSVTITAVGSYDANANPITGVPWSGYGLINGTLNYEVSSPTAPNAKNLSLVEPGDLGQTAIMKLLFAGQATITGGGHYDYLYTGIPGAPGGLYTQVG